MSTTNYLTQAGLGRYHSKIEENYDRVFNGTEAQWAALSADQKAKYKYVAISDDSETGDVVDVIADGNMHPVTSNAVFGVTMAAPQTYSIQITAWANGYMLFYKVGRMVHFVFEAGGSYPKYEDDVPGIIIGYLPEAWRPVGGYDGVLIGRNVGGWATATYYMLPIIFYTANGGINIRGNKTEFENSQYVVGSGAYISKG